MLGELSVQGAWLGYFNRVRHELEWKLFDPARQKAEVVPRWALPPDFIPFHVIPQKGTDDFIILGSGRDSNELQAYRIRKDPSLPTGYQVEKGGSMDFPFWRERSLLIPVRKGDRILFPLESFHFLSYDLKKKEWSALKSQWDRLPREMKTLRRVLEQDGNLYFLGTNENGQTILTPADFQF